MDVATATLAGRLAKRAPAEIRKTVEGTLGLTALAATGMSQTLFTTTSDLSASYQCRMTARITGHGHRLVFTNFSNTGSGSGETSTGNPITVKASIVTAVASGTNIPVTFNGGQTSVTIPDNGIAVSDPLGIDIPQGTVFYVVTNVSVTTAGMKWPQQLYGNAGRNEGQHFAADDTANASGIGSGNYANAYIYGPALIVGVPYKSARAARLATVGDSIMRGMSQIGTTDGLNIIPPLSQTSVVSIAAFGESMSGFSTYFGHRRRIALIDGCTAWMENYGANDMKSGVAFNALAVMQANKIAVWRIVAERLGVPGYTWTLGPYTTSTDSWATVGNQSIPAEPTYSNTNRIALNNWLRDGAPINATTFAPVATGTSPANTIRAGATGHPLAGYFEVADVVESARDSGKFGVGMTFDGIHYSTTAYTAVAAAIDWTKLGIV